ncbi:MAG TPA: ribonuclease HII [Anaerolineaceae bacterium]|nr:ribonuclease HII [Anaerolineaceae bacterium]
MVKKFDLGLLPPAPDLRFELELWAAGVGLVGGVDEAGRGCWAGPVSAAAVIFPPDSSLVETLEGVRDSKQMTPDEREERAPRIRARALGWGVGFASAAEIDEIGIVPATRLAARRALEKLPLPPQYLLIDYLDLPEIAIPQMPLVKGDARSLSIAAASVLAKTARDALMVELDREYPGYGFARHKGYGTPEHQETLRRLGPCAIHRTSFEPLKKCSKPITTEYTENSE